MLSNYIPFELISTQNLHYSIYLFIIGIIGIIINGRNIIIMLISLEIVIFSLNLILISLAVLTNNAYPILWSIYILTVAAGESAIGLAILVAYYRIKGNAGIIGKQILKG